MKIGERASSSPAPSYARSFLSQWAAGSKPTRSVDPQGLPRRTKVTLGRWVRAPGGQWISFWGLGIALFSLPHCSFLRSRNAAPSQGIPPRSVPFVHLWPFCLCSPPGEPLGGPSLSPQRASGVSPLFWSFQEERAGPFHSCLCRTWRWARRTLQRPVAPLQQPARAS